MPPGPARPRPTSSAIASRTCGIAHAVRHEKPVGGGQHRAPAPARSAPRGPAPSRAGRPSRPPCPRTPTGATSPSSSALVACVVLWARKTTSSGATPDVLEHLAEHLDHAAGNAAGMIVRGQHRVPADHLARRVVDQHGLGEGAADVDADAIAARRLALLGHRCGRRCQVIAVPSPGSESQVAPALMDG